MSGPARGVVGERALIDGRSDGSLTARVAIGSIEDVRGHEIYLPIASPDIEAPGKARRTYLLLGDATELNLLSTLVANVTGADTQRPLPKRIGSLPSRTGALYLGVPAARLDDHRPTQRPPTNHRLYGQSILAPFSAQLREGLSARQALLETRLSTPACFSEWRSRRLRGQSVSLAQEHSCTFN